ncbi:MAG TPA: APC family permease [Bryobacteraceae bacterium]|nr:APC family permease [Bryobacteraceae bacterium]
MAQQGRAAAPKVVVATTVALSFISFWRGASIVLGDLASSSFYAGGIAEQAIGRSAPWLVLGVMLFAFAVRSVYLESSSMYVRGGVYVVVRDSMGPFMARLSVSALVFDYILTAPISSVSAGQYLGRLFNELSEMTHFGYQINPNHFAAVFGVVVTAYFWRLNTKGVHESSSKALRIIQIMTIMLVILLVWAVVTILLMDSPRLPPLPTPENLSFTPESAGWWKDLGLLNIGFLAVLVAFGHSVLSMSGFETLAQVYREIASPKLKNLKITANIVCVYALISTGLVTLLAGIIIPLGERPKYYQNLIGGLAMNLAGPEFMRFVFHIFVVLVGVLILSSAVNTSIIGANAVLNRVAEDGVLLDWFRKPHKRFGTTHRLLNVIAVLQLATILISRGDVYLLGEAYAFGVVWSFLLKSVGVIALRYQRNDQEYKFPGNLHIRGVEIPIGLGATTLVLLMVAIANLLSKQIATISGIAFTLALFALFTISQRVNRARHRRLQLQRGTSDDNALEYFNLETHPQVVAETVHARPGCILVAVREYTRLKHLKQVLEKTNLRRHDIVVMTVRPVHTRSGEYELSDDQFFGDYEQELFSRVVTMAEKQGKPVELLVIPGSNPFDAMVQTASRLKAARLVTGVSERMSSEELARRIGLAWERLPEPRHPFSLEIISPERRSIYVNLGPHPPRLWPEDLDLVHDLWLELSEKEGLGSKLHHRDVVGVALRRLARDLHSDEKPEILNEVSQEVRKDGEGGQEALRSPDDDVPDS